MGDYLLSFRKPTYMLWKDRLQSFLQSTLRHSSQREVEKISIFQLMDV
jgi:hypothetical protein